MPSLLRLLLLLACEGVARVSGKTEGDKEEGERPRSETAGAWRAGGGGLEARNVSEILDRLTREYDKRLRPDYGGRPVTVGVTMHVSDISAISEVAMDYTVDIYLRQFWRDPRLQFSGIKQSLTIGIEMVHAIWVPDTFFPNEKKSFFHEATTHNSFLRINHHGNVTRSMRLTVTANCPMNLEYFPLDSQNCSLEIESYGYSERDIKYEWAEGTAKSVTSEKTINLAQFRIGDIRIDNRSINLSTGHYSRLSAYFTFRRTIGFYLIQIYLPSSLIVVISWVSFWLNREATQARVAIGVTTVLTMTTLMTSTNSSMPKVSYVKSIDIYLGTCFIIVFASLLEYAAVGYLMKRMRMSRERKKTELLAPISGHGVQMDRRLEALHEDHSWMADESNQYQALMEERRRRPSRQGYLPIPSPAVSPLDASGPLLPPPSHLPSRRPSDRRPSDRWPSERWPSERRGSGQPKARLVQGAYPFPSHFPAHSALPSPDYYPCDCDVELTNVSRNVSRINSYVSRGSRYSERSRASRASITAPDLIPIRLQSRYSAHTFKPSNIDKYSRIFFPLVFGAFHIVYWTVYLNAEAIFGRTY